MRIEAIERLVRRLEASTVAEITLSDETGSLTLRFVGGTSGRSAAPPAGALAAPPAPPRAIVAPAIGRLRLRHPQAEEGDAPAFPRPVVAGEIVAFLDRGVLLRPIVATAAGIIGASLVPEGSLVGYGTPVFPLL